jgi:hypothetical protein
MPENKSGCQPGYLGVRGTGRCGKSTFMRFSVDSLKPPRIYLLDNSTHIAYRTITVVQQNTPASRKRLLDLRSLPLLRR